MTEGFVRDANTSLTQLAWASHGLDRESYSIPRDATYVRAWLANDRVELLALISPV